MKHSSPRGFTLVEVVVSIFVVGVIVTMLAALSNTFLLARDAQYEDVALRIASQELATLRAGTYAGLPSSGPFSDPLLASLPGGAASTTITAFNAKTKQVIVFVSWSGPAGNTRSVSLATLITQTGGL